MPGCRGRPGRGRADVESLGAVFAAGCGRGQCPRGRGAAVVVRGAPRFHPDALSLRRCTRACHVRHFGRPRIRGASRPACRRRGGVVAGRGHRPVAGRGAAGLGPRARTHRVSGGSVVGADSVAESRPLPEGDGADGGAASGRRGGGCGPSLSRADARRLQRIRRCGAPAQRRGRPCGGGRSERGATGIPADAVAVDRPGLSAGMAHSARLRGSGGVGGELPCRATACRREALGEASAQGKPECVDAEGLVVRTGWAGRSPRRTLPAPRSVGW